MHLLPRRPCALEWLSLGCEREHNKNIKPVRAPFEYDADFGITYTTRVCDSLFTDRPRIEHSYTYRELQVDMGRDVRLRVSILVVLEDPATEIQHVLRLEALLLTFPEDTPLSGVLREPGAAVKSTVQCILKVNREH